jgi:hypothetical protein
MAQKELGDKYLNAMQQFCEECRKIDFQKLSRFSASNLSGHGQESSKGT